MTVSRPSFDSVRSVLIELLGLVPVSADPRDEGAYSSAGRWVVGFSDGSSAFVKAESERHETYGVDIEHLIYSSIHAPALPELIGYHRGSGDAPSVLVIEDLSSAAWGIPLSESDAGALRDALDFFETVAPPEGLPEVQGLGTGWAQLAACAREISATGLADKDWLDKHFPILCAATKDVDTTGEQLVKVDAWVQNWCRADRGAVLVDWAWSARGNGMIAKAWGEAGVRAVGGPAGIVLERGHADWAAWMAGQTVQFLLEQNSESPSRLIETERREVSATLAWACDELGIEPPTHAEGFLPRGPWRP